MMPGVREKWFEGRGSREIGAQVETWVWHVQGSAIQDKDYIFSSIRIMYTIPCVAITQTQKVIPVY